MTEHVAPSEPEQRGVFWDGRYERIGSKQVSWYQTRPQMSLDLIDALQLGVSTAVIDVGGGTSTLVDELLRRDFSDITVLDVSASALATARQRLGDPDKVTWLHADVLTWDPARDWDLWHDRALFHFLTSSEDQDKYLQRIDRALRPGGGFIIGTFAADGPDHCSGLPVERYDARGLIDLVSGALGDVLVVEQRREIHTTPSGVSQPFIWIAGTVGQSKADDDHASAPA
ncbi:MAG: class I SAM-dependent methyltransferase [Actinomycetota bacterium]|nr:class I SAM-dependent methyltransferase [Actinomycetota bacterium]